jgi:Tol biopolymer transport system component
MTNTLGRSNIVPAMSGDGTRIAFRSIVHPAGGSPGETDLLLYDTTAGTVTSFGRIPTVSESSMLAFSRNGSRLAFASRTDPTGENADGNEEIFLSDITTRMLTQVTHTTGDDNQSPVTNGDGTRIAFSSSANLTGENVDGSLEVVLFDVTTATATQVTQTPTGALNQPGALSDDGTRISVTHVERFGEDGELFLVDVANGTRTSISRTFALGRMSADGTRIAFSAPANFPFPAPPSGSILAATCGFVVNDLVSLTARDVPDESGAG